MNLVCCIAARGTGTRIERMTWAPVYRTFNVVYVGEDTVTEHNHQIVAEATGRTQKEVPTSA
jgi:hypothetical protein